ncbi:aspartyl protease family protein [Phenylobacterium sp.]|uniref:aspartyl protease family protein n=1 Tax=Phenylobacterium sp. TaxID=1871053 RepID=UPI0028A297A1|nr:aspartyl protease family protein [Phenylobacterium sp.]
MQTIDRRTMGLGLLALTGCAAPRPPPVLINMADVPPPPILAPGDDGAELATDADMSGRVTAPVRINGQGPFDFVVDTGANRTVITSELAARLGLPDAGPADVHGVAGVEPSNTATIDLLQVDAVETRSIRAPTLSRSRLGADGLLGVDVLRGRRVTVDFLKNEFRITPSRGPGAPKADLALSAAAASRLPQADALSGRQIVVPARYRFGQLIIIGADVSGRPVTAFMDSGSQSTVGNAALRRLVLGTTEIRAPRYVVPVLSATGQTARGELAVLPLLRIGGLDITGLTTVFADLHVFDIWDLKAKPSLLIGIDAMRQFDAITLDYGRRQVIFTLPAGSPRRRRPTT